MSRDSNRFKLDPTIVALNSQSAGQNYGHAISQAFKDLGDIENNKINLQLADTKNQYEEIKLNSIKDELDDDKTFNNYLLSEDKNEFLKNNKFKTSKYSLMGEDYKNSLSLKEQEGHVKSALTMFSDDKGNFNRNEAFTHLNKKFKEGVISEKQLYDIADAIDQRTQSGIYTPKISIKDQWDIKKTEAEIKKINSDTNKNYHSIKNEQSDYFDKNDPLRKEKMTYLSLVNSGAIEDKGFGNWLSETGGKVTANVKLENVTQAKNKLTEQFNGTEQILHLINKYDPSKFGILDSFAQKSREVTGLHNQNSSDLESDMVALKGAMAKAMGGANPSNYEQKMGDQVVGGTWNTEEGAAAKYKATLERAIISQEQTINQIARAGYDTAEQQAQLNKYIDIANNLKDWKGSTSVAEHLAKKQNQQTNQNGTKVLRSQNQNNQPTQQNTNQPSWRDYE